MPTLLTLQGIFRRVFYAGLLLYGLVKKLNRVPIQRKIVKNDTLKAGTQEFPSQNYESFKGAFRFFQRSLELNSPR